MDEFAMCRNRSFAEYCYALPKSGVPNLGYMNPRGPFAYPKGYI